MSDVSASEVNVTARQKELVTESEETESKPQEEPSDKVSTPPRTEMVAVTRSLIILGEPGSVSAIVRVPVIVWPNSENVANCVIGNSSEPSNKVDGVWVPTCRVSDTTAWAKASPPTIGNEPKARALARASFAPMNWGERLSVIRRSPRCATSKNSSTS